MRAYIHTYMYILIYRYIIVLLFHRLFSPSAILFCYFCCCCGGRIKENKDWVVFFFLFHLFAICQRMCAFCVPVKREIIPANPNYCLLLFHLVCVDIEILGWLYQFFVGYFFFTHVLSTFPLISRSYPFGRDVYFFFLFFGSIFWIFLAFVVFRSSLEGRGTFVCSPTLQCAITVIKKKFCSFSLNSLAFSLSFFLSHFSRISLTISRFPMYFEFDNFRLKFHFRLNYTQ